MKASIGNGPVQASPDGSFEITVLKDQPVRIHLESEEFDSRLLVDWRLEVLPA